MKLKKHYLADYKPLGFMVHAIHLNFIIELSSVLVRTKLIIEPKQANGELLFLDGEAQLEEISLNQRALLVDEYHLNKDGITLLTTPKEQFELEMVTRVYPAQNKSLTGLYASSGNLFTQCEAEGFRKITYFFDRPDVMTEYFVTIQADVEQYPVLLSNGNLVDSGTLAENQHWVSWHDPYKKPSYLFALVAGKLACNSAEFVTCSGKKVAIDFYTTPQNIAKTNFAIASLKRAMQWDETRFGLEYDLDLFMVVAVEDFNMGAMENKGLNIFNTKYVLATSDTATDQDFVNIESVIGHEYFHNYTGNRVTCRDWFQLTLKEGLTVFRDQEFSADMASRATRRIAEVKSLREFQFPEDAGPTSHPIRPEVYEQINNFYTTTVYEKGAEVIRMYHTILGEAGFQKGMKLYFQRHDGSAVTCEDFLQAMADANEVDLTQFKNWYRQAGTPILKVTSDYNALNNELKLTFKQNIKSIKKFQALMLPVKLGLIDQAGQMLRFKIKASSAWVDETVLLLKQKKTKVTLLLKTGSVPILSLLREFSAPVILQYKQSEQDLLTLFNFDKDEYVRWESSQLLYKKYIKRFIMAKNKAQKLPNTVKLTSQLSELIDNENNYALLALMLRVPGFSELLEEFAPIDPVLLQKQILHFKNNIARQCLQAMQTKYQVLLAQEASDAYPNKQEYHPELEAIRNLQNVLRAYLVIADEHCVKDLCAKYQQTSINMTHRMGILEAINHQESQARDDLLTLFVTQFKENPLVLDKYFSLIGSSFAKNTFNKVKESLHSPYFSLTNPNKVRALLFSFARNPLYFHSADGSGYEFIIKLIAKIDKFNPQLASRLVELFKITTKLDTKRQKIIKKQLKWLLKRVKSSDVLELGNKIYDSIE